MISVYGRLRRDDEAEEAYRKAVALDPSHAETYYNFGVFCFERRRLAEARASFEQAVKLNPRHAEALHNWAVILEGEGKWDQAAALYGRALDAKPAYPLAHFHLSGQANTDGPPSTLGLPAARARRAIPNLLFLDVHAAGKNRIGPGEFFRRGRPVLFSSTSGPPSSREDRRRQPGCPAAA